MNVSVKSCGKGLGWFLFGLGFSWRGRWNIQQLLFLLLLLLKFFFFFIFIFFYIFSLLSKLTFTEYHNYLAFCWNCSTWNSKLRILLQLVIFGVAGGSDAWFGFQWSSKVGSLYLIVAVDGLTKHVGASRWRSLSQGGLSGSPAKNAKALFIHPTWYLKNPKIPAFSTISNHFPTIFLPKCVFFFSGEVFFQPFSSHVSFFCILSQWQDFCLLKR